MVGEQAELVSLGFAEIGLIGFFEEKEEIEDVVFRENEVNDPCPSAFPSIALGHPDFAKPVATHEQISVFRIGQQFPLRCAVVFITYEIDDLCREKRRFDESEVHEKQNTMYPIRVKL